MITFLSWYLPETLSFLNMKHIIVRNKNLASVEVTQIVITLLNILALERESILPQFHKKFLKANSFPIPDENHLVRLRLYRAAIALA